MTPVFSPLRWACALFFLGVLTVQSSIAQPVDTRLTVPALGAAGAGKVPQFLGHPVHVHRQAHPAVADQGNAEFLLAHHALVAGIAA